MAGATAVELEIGSIAAGGDGVGRIGGLVVFVPRTAPGDLVRARVAPAVGRRFVRGSLEAVLRPSPDRVEPSCAHYVIDRCGGCQLQHLGYDAQLAAKAGIVRDALTRLARREVGTVAVAASPLHWRYRRKLTLAMRRVRGREWVAGLHRFDAPDDVFPLTDCPITDAGVVGIWRQISEHVDLLPDAAALRVAVRALSEGYAFVVEGGERWGRAESRALAAAVPGLAEIWWTAGSRAAPPSGGGPANRRRRGSRGSRGSRGGPGGARGPDRRGMRGPRPGRMPARLMTVPTRRQAHAPVSADRSAERVVAAGSDRAGGRGAATGASFVQVNAEVGAAVHAGVARRALAYDPATAVDGYAGTGTTAAALARHGVRVTAIEADRDAAGWASRTLPPGSRMIAGRVEDVLSRALPADVVVLNPPRAGLDPAVPRTLAQAAPPPRAVIYVSCDPATLARDLARLDGWRIADVQAYDMFPQTAHVETVCELVPPPAHQRAAEAGR